MFYRGTNAQQDGRFSDKEKKLTKSISWPEELNHRINLVKVLDNLSFTFFCSCEGSSNLRSTFKCSDSGLANE